MAPEGKRNKALSDRGKRRLKWWKDKKKNAEGKEKAKPIDTRDMRDYGYYLGQVPPMASQAPCGQSPYGHFTQQGQPMPQHFHHNYMPHYPTMGMPVADQKNAQMYGKSSELQGKSIQFPSHNSQHGQVPPLSINTNYLPSPDDEPPPITPPPQRERFSYTRYQLELLNSIFDKVRYPNSIQKQLIAKRVGITRDQVKVWFQNRRRKDVVGPGGNKGKSPESALLLDKNEPKMVPDHVRSSIVNELVRYENDPKGQKLRARLAANELRPKPYDISARPGQLHRPSPENKTGSSGGLSVPAPLVVLPPQAYSSHMPSTPFSTSQSEGLNNLPASPESSTTDSHSTSLNSTAPSPQTASPPSSNPSAVLPLNPLDMPAPPNAVAPVSSDMDDVRRKLSSAINSGSPPGICGKMRQSTVKYGLTSSNMHPVSTPQQPLSVTIPGYQHRVHKYSPLSSDESVPKNIRPGALPTAVPMPAWSSSTSSSNSTSSDDLTSFKFDNVGSSLTKPADYSGYQQQQQQQASQHGQGTAQPPTTSPVQMPPISNMDYTKYSYPQIPVNSVPVQYSYGQMVDTKPLNIDRVFPFSLMAEPAMRFGAMPSYASDPYASGMKNNGAPIPRDPYQPVYISSYNNPYYASDNPAWSSAVGEKDPRNYTA